MVSQIGPVPPSLDPNLVSQAQSRAHNTTPLTNTLLNQTTALTQGYRQFVFQYSQQFNTGTSGSFTFVNSRSLLNSSTPALQSVDQRILRLAGQPEPAAGLQPGVNNRDIRVAKNNMKVTQPASEAAGRDHGQRGAQSVLGPGEFQRSGAHQGAGAGDARRSCIDGNKKQVEIGALPAIEVTRAAAEVSASKEDLLIAQTNVAQQEIVLKNALNRNSMQNTWLDDVHIVPLDHIEVPKTEEIRPVQDLIQEAHGEPAGDRAQQDQYGQLARSC